jgi:hypothetical protein
MRYRRDHTVMPESLKGNAAGTCASPTPWLSAIAFVSQEGPGSG